MNFKENKILAICTECGKTKFCGETCKNCSDPSFSIETAKYAVAMKEAVELWSKADCEEHAIPCKATIKQFAETIANLKKRIATLESGIAAHKSIKIDIDDHDKNLWELI